MIKKTITYKDLYGRELSEDFYFNYNKADLLRLQAQNKQGMDAHLQTLVDSEDTPRILNAFEELIAMAYGERSADGKHFVKSEEISKAFLQTEAYSELIFEFFTNPSTAAEFFSALAPDDYTGSRNSAPVRADGRPVVQDRQPKQAPQAPVYQSVQDVPQELMTVQDSYQAPQAPSNDQADYEAWKAAGKPIVPGPNSVQ